MPTSTTSSQGNEFANLGARLIRFGQALQEGSTTVGELTSLAAACGISFKLKATAEQGEPQNG
ncbi:hypothetical protein PCAU_1945 [Pseudomonas chlororaphis subsp. aurantiaca]|uniref:hypothetical protein n=1 Tax=Pseudomonas chlororaphis TaxID=587753 RepID=UPI000789CD4C|nr:hypothetical protein [Pseudomonas chlororaphis]AMS13180.1 hypothetical protein A3218_02185 [Pseudomonas chlororaphis]BAV74154.1 hypothetical protein PCAU_1945 [Pseudomonas chlororaphis subsp. aurantiaca]